MSPPLLPNGRNFPTTFLVTFNNLISMGPFVMGAHRHGQEEHLPPSGNVVKWFCALVVTAKRSVDELLICIIFYNLSSASGGFASRPPAGLHSWTLLGDFRPQTLN